MGNTVVDNTILGNAIDSQKWLWLMISAFPGVGPAQMQKLQSLYSNPEMLIASSRQDFEAQGLSAKACEVLSSKRNRLMAEKKAQVVAEWLNASPDHHLLMRGDTKYPYLLSQVEYAPTFLFVKGQLSFLSHQQIAMVGTRKPTPSGRETAFAFSKALVQSGWTITSGMAIGIDSFCHQGALAADVPSTVAVLGCGVDVVYPRQNSRVYQEIAESGAVVSEYFPGTAPDRKLFPRRNRLISGLSQGVIVVEAAIKSGSLITAQYAVEQGREVFAVPGPIYSAQSQGSHALIKQGAYLVDSPEEVSAHLKSGEHWLNLNNEAADTFISERPVNEKPVSARFVSESKSEKPLIKSNHCASPLSVEDKQKAIADLALTKNEQIVVENLEAHSISVDLLVERTQMPVKDILAVLLMLEMKGCARQDNGGGYQLALKS